MTITVKNLSKSYGSIKALDIDQLTIAPGHAYGLVGANGAGKTTFFKCLTNIITDYSGEIIFDGHNPRKETAILTKMGIVLDDLSVYKDYSARFNIQYFAGLRGHYDAVAAEKLADELGLLAALDRPVKTFSYGMQKKLVLLIALINSAEVLILDEPFRGLDQKTVKWFQDYLREWASAEHTLIISSHVQTDLESLCDTVFMIDQGRLVKTVDLTSVNDQAFRLISTDNDALFADLLASAEVSFDKTATGFKIDINSEQWQTLYPQLGEHAIAITAMSKVSVLDQQEVN
ncbi:ABC transporter ATP-binding protein [Pediococcus inopinatus]|uniref:ABC transporter ATP-binding protein n=1 Tax=Pediococcus TaxID=1253 RepID=UPI002B261890|nr:ABC transporter ATP-binding protein [Pediococcus inopinatus]WPC17768.1 ABC transporter ATP-binding protein [Pediococcus inopinatus]